VPDRSIEVDNLEAAFQGIKRAEFAIQYGPADEPWGLRRFLVREPLAKLVNIHAHTK
jgi:hypothetical protein